MEIPYIPKDAPYSGDQKAWLSGFLAGLHSRLVIGDNQNNHDTQTTVLKPIDILYGTQTGNSEEVANDAADIARNRGYQPRVAELDSVDLNQLSNMEKALIVVSTYGEGEMPDNGQLFWDAISATTAPRLESLEYGVIGLGDTSYEFFCQAGKLIDTRLEQLGASRFASRLDCDVEFEEPSKNWVLENLPEVGVADPKITLADSPKPKWNRKNPYAAEVIENTNLSGDTSAKEIRHIAISLPEEELSYHTGDALAVVPENSPELVKLWIDALKLDFKSELDCYDRTLGDLLTHSFEISTPSKDFIRGIEPLLKNDQFTRLVNDDDKAPLQRFLWGKDCLDLIQLNDKISFDINELLNWLKPLQHRAYSISSSPLANESEVHLTVAAVRWNYNDRPHHGVCSTYLADMCPAGKLTEVFILPNKAFRIPADDSASMIMVGPGTGVAPFRAFLQERQERGASGFNWLFFGDQHRECDFIYESEITKMFKSGLLDRLDLAFSRDQKEKVYVQHKMLENGKDIYAQLMDGAYFYVCGDASRMAKDVDAALHNIAEIHGGLSSEDAAAFVDGLKREKRYLRDVY
ncbi:MAG: sulfite reductase subunit alpha [Opitutae bacterium]|nr:sulfite reductase subunit alpha [Opitutae bacterium]